VSEVRKVKVIVEYDGTAYKGFQVQLDAPTIQGELEDALESVTREHIRIVGAGRTDAGVHARGQVVHFVTAWRHSMAVLQRAWNANLPAAIAVRDLEVVPENFHARFNASSREYRYSIYTGAVRQPLRARISHHIAAPLDLVLMAEAARCLVGQHDFSAFGRPPWGTNAVRTVYRAAFDAKGDMLYFDIKANAFLRRMVRLIVGTLLLVGRGKLSPSGFQEILRSGDPNHPVASAPACGLCLVRVNYLSSIGRQTLRGSRVSTL